MNEYIIVSSRDPEELAVSVSDKVTEGYVPVGGLIYALSWWWQALHKKYLPFPKE